MDALNLVFGTNHLDTERNSSDLGYLLFERRPEAFLLRGMQVNIAMRGKGLSRLLLAIWVQLCIELKVKPQVSFGYPNHVNVNPNPPALA